MHNISLQRTAPCGLAAELKSLCAQVMRLRNLRGLPDRETRRSARVASRRVSSSSEPAATAQGMFCGPARGGQQRGSRAHRRGFVRRPCRFLPQSFPSSGPVAVVGQRYGCSSLAPSFAQRPCAQHCLAADARLRPASHEQLSMNLNLQPAPRRAPLKASLGTRFVPFS
jgi:hypothetical protein